MILFIFIFFGSGSRQNLSNDQDQGKNDMTLIHNFFTVFHYSLKPGNMYRYRMYADPKYVKTRLFYAYTAVLQ